jgi:hypothetical protein
MAAKKLFLLILLIIGLFLIESCKPINIFSPLVDPSNMGDDAKLDAGYNAMDDGDYNQAIDYFTDVIQGDASGETLSEAYVGRGAAYLHSSSGNVGAVTEGIINGDIDISKPGEVIRLMVTDGDYVTFFAAMKLAAADYSSAMSLLGADMTASRLQDTYETNLIAATGVGAKKIAETYNIPPWVIPTNSINEEIDEILKDDGSSTHLFDIDTWEDSALGNNGLNQYVEGTPAESEMMVYLTNAFNACKYMETNVPLGLDQQDVLDMETGINDWVQYGLGEVPLN